MRAFVTGATGFIGRPLAERLRAAPGLEATALVRTPGATGLDEVVGDLERPDTYRAALAGQDAVLHLAALTGKAPAADHERVNRAGTEALLEAAKAAGVKRFVFVSTIAVKYPSLAGYPYAQAKRAAERAVRGSGLDVTILRPTIVTGPGSPIVKSLAGLAGLPVTPLFGDGRTRVQPIAADDVAGAALDALVSGAGPEVDLGGPDVVTFDDLMDRLRVRRGRPPGKLLHLPAGLAAWGLRLLEPALRSVLPVTAGQISAFRFHGVADPTPFLEARLERFASLDAQLEVSLDG